MKGCEGVQFFAIKAFEFCENSEMTIDVGIYCHATRDDQGIRQQRSHEDIRIRRVRMMTSIVAAIASGGQPYSGRRIDVV